MKTLTLLVVFALLSLRTASLTQAQTNRISPTPTASIAAELSATASALVATPAAQIEQQLQEKKDQDITQSTPTQKSKLAAFLDDHPIGALSWDNFLQFGIRNAINHGLPANIIVLLLLFPVITSIIAVSRHLIGLQGFGVYIPSVLAVAFVSTGIFSGVIMFMAVLLSAIISRTLTKKFHLPYLPRTAMLLFGVSLFILFFLMGAAQLSLIPLLSIDIFPLLIIMLLTENFMESQLFTSQSAAIRLTLETLFIAIVCSLFMGLDIVQQFVLLKPEIVLIVIAITNLAIGRYTGLRLLEYVRFRSIINHD